MGDRIASPPLETAAECLCSKAGVPALEHKHSWNRLIEPVSLVDSGEIKFPNSKCRKASRKM